MKTHMVSVLYRGKRYTLFVLFPEGVKPFINDEIIKKITETDPFRGETIGIGY
jgi:hypothetical protein